MSDTNDMRKANNVIAGANALEGDVSEIRFKAQVALMERGK